MSTRRTFLKSVGLAAVPLARPGRLLADAEPKGRPNILFIMSDDHAALATSCYGSRINTTPHIDRLAREGMRFTNCLCTNSLCAPSRAVILTGRYSHLNGITDNRRRFDGSQQTFPKLLQKAGYETAIVGKWHLKSPPTGFDYWNVLPGQGRYRNPVMLEMGEKKTHQGYATDIITDEAIRWLKRRKGGRPFCLLCHHKAVHGPVDHFDPKHAKLYEDARLPEPPTLHDDYRTRSKAAAAPGHFFRLEAMGRHLRAQPPKGLAGKALRSWMYQEFFKRYLRLVASLDENIGRLLDHLDAAGLAANTVVVYTSDQGFFLGEHGWFNKMWIYEESLRMPLLVRYPKEIKAGSVNADMVLNLDFAPTLLDFAGVPRPAEMQGRSFLSLLRGHAPEDWRGSMYYHYYGHYGVAEHYGVRTRRHKLIHFPSIGAWELFDLEKDPRELHNVYGDPAYASVAEQLKAELARLRKQFGDTDTAGAPTTAHPDFAVVRDGQVKASKLGYTLTGGRDGLALRKTPKPFTTRAVLHCKLRSLGKGGRQNGFISFGPDPAPEHLVHCGVYIKAGQYVIIHGGPGGSEDERVTKDATFDASKTFDVTVAVDLVQRSITLTVDGVALKAPLRKPWKAIGYVGYGAHSAATDFSTLEAKGE